MTRDFAFEVAAPTPSTPKMHNYDENDVSLDVSPPLTPAESSGSGNKDSGLDRRSTWGSAKLVLHGVKAANKFSTLRDLVGTDAYVDESRLKMMKALGEGAFAKVQQAQLMPAPQPAADGGSLQRQSSELRDRIVAVKILRRELLEDPEQVQLFVREVALLRKLRHRHIVRFLGCSWRRSNAGGEDSSVGSSSTPQEMYFVQEFCGGGSLGDLVRKQMMSPFKRLYSDADALRWCLHIARALSYLHGSRPVVIHRDLKLENVMLSSGATEESDAKLGDFGLARLTPHAEKEKLERITNLLAQPKKEWEAALSPSKRMSSKGLDKVLDRMLTGTTVRSERSTMRTSVPGSMLSSTRSMAEASHRDLTGNTGSFGYMAPEVSRSQQYNARADIFSLGMCMYNLFNRTIPTIQILLNGDESHLELYALKVAEGYRPPMLSTVPDSVKDAIAACWKGAADLRPSANEVVVMLESIEASGEINADPPAGSGTGGGCNCCVM